MCGSATIWAKIAFVAICIALILDIVGFATPSWMVYQTDTTSVRVGLWRMKVCVGTSCQEDTVASSLQTDEFTITQAFEILAFVLFLAATIVVGIYVFAPAARGSCMAITAMSLCFLAFFFAFIGMITWMVYVPDPYVVSYSMGLTVLAAILGLIAGLLLIPEVLNGGNRGPKGGRRVGSPPNSRFRR